MNIVNYKPFTGQTIEEAINAAVRLAKEKNCTVVTVMNDIVMFVNKKTNPKQATKDYRDKVNLRYYINQFKMEEYKR